MSRGWVGEREVGRLRRKEIGTSLGKNEPVSGEEGIVYAARNATKSVRSFVVDGDCDARNIKPN